MVLRECRIDWNTTSIQTNENVLDMDIMSIVWCSLDAFRCLVATVQTNFDFSNYVYRFYWIGCMRALLCVWAHSFKRSCCVLLCFFFAFFLLSLNCGKYEGKKKETSNNNNKTSQPESLKHIEKLGTGFFSFIFHLLYSLASILPTKFVEIGKNQLNNTKRKKKREQ